jgi:Rod binding domain-containing protein
MKIPVSKLNAALAPGAVNRPKESAALKPLTGADFAGHLEDAMGGGEDATRAGGVHSNLRPLTPLDRVPGVKDTSVTLKPLDQRDRGLPPVTSLAPLGETQYQHASSRPPKTEHEKIEETARKWVAQTFYGTMLKQMRESPFKSEIFSGGRGGQAFSSLLDQHLAEHMTRGTGNKLVNAIARKLEAAGNYQKQSRALPKPAAGATPNTTPNTTPNNTPRLPHVTTSLRA